MAHEYDLIIKALAEQHPEDFVELVRGFPVESVYRAEKEAVAVKRENDVIFKIKESGYEYYLVMEVQVRPGREIPQRLLEYTAMQHREYNKPVYPVVINLTGKQKHNKTYEFECLDLTVISFNYRVQNMIEYPGRKFLRKCPVGIIPLIPLMYHDENPEDVLAKCVKKVENEVDDENLRSDLFIGLAVMSSLKMAKAIILKVIEVTKMETSPLFDGIREKWIDKGIQQGMQQGIKGIKDAVLETLQDKFHTYPDTIEKKLSVIDDIATIKTLLRRAIKANDTDEFVQFLDKLPK